MLAKYSLSCSQNKQVKCGSQHVSHYITDGGGVFSTHSGTLRGVIYSQYDI